MKHGIYLALLLLLNACGGGGGGDNGEKPLNNGNGSPDSGSSQLLNSSNTRSLGVDILQSQGFVANSLHALVALASNNPTGGEVACAEGGSVDTTVEAASGSFASAGDKLLISFKDCLDDLHDIKAIRNGSIEFQITTGAIGGNYSASLSLSDFTEQLAQLTWQLDGDFSVTVEGESQSFKAENVSVKNGELQLSVSTYNLTLIASPSNANSYYKYEANATPYAFTFSVETPENLTGDNYYCATSGTVKLVASDTSELTITANPGENYTLQSDSFQDTVNCSEIMPRQSGGEITPPPSPQF